MRFLFVWSAIAVVCASQNSSSSGHGHANSSFLSDPILPKNSSSTYKPLFQPYLNSTPVFQNQSLIQALSSGSTALRKRSTAALPDGVCAPGQPCTNGACCSNTGVCSYAPSSCSAQYCISNCDAKAPCGEYASPGNATCPLNVCCSQYGFCGTTDDFCGTGCQEGYGDCGPANTPSCAGSSSNARRIGYYESWSNTRSCDNRSPEDLDLTGLTHLNFAFAFFDPSTFKVTPMDANSASLYSRFTALKSKKSGLETWISVGGWSFNDDTNSPNTRTAFSDMVSSASNRATFISGLTSFMKTYGFDGVDIDWEYPGADDRGGLPKDTGNFAELVAEMRASFGTGYGISATVPSSFWYMQHFDVLDMQDSLDWFNFMSYDIHGTWDSSDKFTGPYIRPHTNLTEIKDGLSLLWRAGVQPSKVVLGLGWYGRSFTLTDPSCNTPNGVCQFTAGGNPGSCTDSAGTLSNAEIKRVIASGVGTQSLDTVAAVRWLTWDSNQWVSYDDGVTMQLKIQAANDLCLGGTMIWSIDQDNTAGDSMSDLLGIGLANGVSEAESQAYKNQMNNAALQKQIAQSCYWSLCGQDCQNGYFGVTESHGQVANIQQNSVCENGDFQTLCCAPGTTMGTCQWEGFRGVGLPCTPVCNSTTDIIVAQNSNSYQENGDDQLSDLTCTGGYQAYCCAGFIPSSKTNTGNIFLYGQGVFTKRNEIMRRDLEERGAVKGVVAGGLTYGVCAAALAALIAAAPFTFGLSLLGIPAEVLLCAAAGIAVAAAGFASKPSAPPQAPPKPPPPVAQPHTGVPTTVKGRSSYGQWPLLDFGTVAQTTGCDCFVTYTCRYGLGWDEVCDNQRWAIDKMLNGNTVFNPRAVGRAPNRNQASWSNQRGGPFRTLVQGSRNPTNARCEVDEFPMGNLEESGNNNPQACRLVNKVGNGAQGNDYNAWKMAQWSRCSSFRKTICRSKDAPPATWKFNQVNGNRGIGVGQHFITAYGFDSQTANSICFASYSYTDANNARQSTTVADHGFRGLNDDPMFGHPYNWPVQNWKVNPAPQASSNLRPTSVASAAYLKRDMIQGIIAETGNTTTTATSTAICHADVNAPVYDAVHDPAYDAVDIDFDDYQLEDMMGNAIDGKDCDIIYDEVSESTIRLVNEDGSYEDVDYDYPEAPVTRADSVVDATLMPAKSTPKPSDTVPKVPQMTAAGSSLENKVAIAAPLPTTAPW